MKPSSPVLYNNSVQQIARASNEGGEAGVRPTAAGKGLSSRKVMPQDLSPGVDVLKAA
jgi:hypothetical protein